MGKGERRKVGRKEKGEEKRRKIKYIKVCTTDSPGRPVRTLTTFLVVKTFEACMDHV